MSLGAGQRRTLEAICDAFCPPDGPEVPGVTDAVLELAARDPGALERLSALLRVWDLPFAWRRFSDLPRERREAVLRSWRDSRIPARRAAFHGLRKGSLISYYGDERTWPALGYPGPPTVPAAEPDAVETLSPAGGAVLDCDVCVVGSGAGGGVAAAVLAGAGLDVLVLEAGPHVPTGELGGPEVPGYRRLYWRAAAATTADGGIGLLAGACLGGTTTINYTTSFRTPEDVRAEWAAAGAPWLGTAELDRSLDAVWERLGVNTDHNRPAARDEVMARGLGALGWHVAAMPRNVRGCDQGRVCGMCGFGCRIRAKQSTLETWLADAHAAGARLVTGARALRVVLAGGEATGVEAETAAGSLTVRSRAVAAACGALETPALLRRSGLENPNVGRHLHLHPTTAVSAVFAEDVRPWEGTMQALYSDQHADLDWGYGLKYETAAIHPGVVAAFAPWPGAREHAELMRQLPRVSGIGILLRDRDGGEVRVGRDGEARVHYRVSRYDRAHVRVGVEGAAQILEAAGAVRIFSSSSRLVDYEPGRRGDLAGFVRAADACGYGPGRCVFYAFHPTGSARLGASPAASACNPDGETWEARNLHVLDGSVLPSAPGVNPMVTIEALAHRNAAVLAARLS